MLDVVYHYLLDHVFGQLDCIGHALVLSLYHGFPFPSPDSH